MTASIARCIFALLLAACHGHEDSTPAKPSNVEAAACDSPALAAAWDSFARTATDYELAVKLDRESFGVDGQRSERRSAARDAADAAQEASAAATAAAAAWRSGNGSAAHQTAIGKVNGYVTAAQRAAALGLAVVDTIVFIPPPLPDGADDDPAVIAGKVRAAAETAEAKHQLAAIHTRVDGGLATVREALAKVETLARACP